MYNVTNDSAGIIIYKVCLEGKQKTVQNHSLPDFVYDFTQFISKIHLIIKCIFLSLIFLLLSFSFINV